MRRESTKTIIIAAALTMLASFPANSASIEEFQTEEYYGSGGLDLINAAEAYSKGYTGKGVTIGINDYPVNLEHESFSSKTGSKYIGSTNLDGIDWKSNDHGSHVAGIAAGAKNDKGMHGVAFDADIICTSWLEANFDFPKYDSFTQIKTINNSWGGDISFDNYKYLYEIKDDLSSDKVLEKLYENLDQKGVLDLLSPIMKAASKERLLIFANCNNGKHDTSLIPFVHWLNNKDLNNLISVTAVLNSYENNTHLERNPDGSITGDFICAPFSNLGKYYEDNIISAPGWNILSSDSMEKEGYVCLSGTSMATPLVTGGAALVQQAFPYLNPKQIGDVLLSTANSNINTKYPFCVTDSFESAYDNNGNLFYKYFANIYYLDERTENDDEQIEKDLLSFANFIKDDDNSGKRQSTCIERAIDQGNISVYYQTPIQELVGQGILDVGKAVSGPGALNARRLEKENISSKYLTEGQKTVMCEIDTKGYDSVWSNDIKEILVGKLADDSIEEDLRERYNYYDLNWISNDKADKWAKLLTKAYVDEFNNRVEKSGLEGLHVGLLKSGKGILKLEGNNSYKGATVVTDGAIAVNGSVAGDAYSEKDGVIMGKGKINGTLYNNNIAVAGDNNEGNLSLGALDSKGKLVSALNNGENTKFIVDGEANIDGSTIVVAGLLPGESCTVLKADSITGKLANSQENTTGTTAFLKEYAKIENNEVKYVYDLSPNYAGVTSKQAKAFDAIKRMYLKLMSEYNGESASSKKNSSKENLQISRHPSVRHSSDTSATCSHPVARLHADIHVGSPQVEALEDINSDNSNEAQSISRGSYRAATTPQQMAQILTFINLPAQQAGPALSAVVNNAAAQSMTLVQRNSMTGDILSSHFLRPLLEEGKPRSGRGGDRAIFNPDSKTKTSSQADSKNTPFQKGCRQGGRRASERQEVSESQGCPQSGQGDFQERKDWIATQSSTAYNDEIAETSDIDKQSPSALRSFALCSKKLDCHADKSARNDDNNSGVSNTLLLNKVSSSSVTTPTCQRQATSPQGEALGQSATSTSDSNDHGAWFKFVYNKGEMRDGARYHGRSGIIGYDLKLTENKSYGLFFGHGNNTLDGFDDAWAKNKIEENKYGVYASRKNNKASGYLYLDYGKVDNELRRNLTNLGLSTNVKYKGNLFEIGGEYKLTPKNQKNKTWKVYPYINLQFSKYKQDGFHEQEGGIYNHVVDGKTNNYAAGQLGLEFNFSNEKENYVLRLAGKTAFSGYEPKLTYSFEGDTANSYELDNEQDKKHLLVSFKGERKISTDTLLSADFSMQRGSHDRDMKASLSFWRKF